MNLFIKNMFTSFDSIIPLVETNPKEKIQKENTKYTKMFIVLS